MKKNTFTKRFLTLFSAFLLPTLILAVLLPLQESYAIYDGVIRLHVLADSDSEEEQALKLTVRDAILDEMSDAFNGYTSKEDAEKTLAEKLDEIEAIAEETVKKEGYTHDVTVTLCREYYPTREYEGMRLPAGEYLSLRVLIGSGEGQNWWCMVYPPLCTSSARADEALSEAGFTPNQVRLLTEEEETEYVLRFKIVETASEFAEKVKGFFTR